MPSIHLDPTAELNLTAWSLATGGKEFSGLGIIRKEGDVFHVQDVFLLGVGSEVFTEFSPARQRDLPRDGLKLWFHRHPLGRLATPRPARRPWPAQLVRHRRAYRHTGAAGRTA